MQIHGETGKRYVDDGRIELQREDEPSTATAVIFQTNRSSPPDSLEALGKGRQDLIGGANAGQTREDIFKGEAMMLGVLAGAGVFDQHKGKSQSGALPRGGFDAYVGRNAGQDDRVDPAVLELLLQVGAGEGAPMTLGNKDVAGLKASRSNLISDATAGRGFVAHVVRLIDGKLQKIVSKSTRTYTTGAPLARKAFAKLHGISDNLIGTVRRRGHAENGILEIDEDKCCLLRVELEFRHISSLLKMFINRG